MPYWLLFANVQTVANWPKDSLGLTIFTLGTLIATTTRRGMPGMCFTGRLLMLGDCLDHEATDSFVQLVEIARPRHAQKRLACSHHTAVCLALEAQASPMSLFPFIVQEASPTHAF